MRKRTVLIVVGVLVLLLLGSFLGWAVASNHGRKRCPFLSDFYNEEIPLTMADWEVLYFTAYNNCEEYLTDKLIQESCKAFLLEMGLTVTVNTKTQSPWNVYLGEGRFSVSDRELRAAYIEAAERVLENIRIYFSEEGSGLSDQEITINFAIRGSPIGTWRGGSFKLAGEE